MPKDWTCVCEWAIDWYFSSFRCAVPSAAAPAVDNVAWMYYHYYYYYYYYYYTVVNARLVFHVVKNRKCRTITDHRRNAQRYSSVFRCCLKVGQFERSDTKCCGRLFQTTGAEWRKARSANTDLTRSTCSRPWTSDRRWCVEARDRIRSCW